MAREKGQTETVAIGEILVGHLMTWADTPVVRFFYTKTNASARGMVFYGDFDTRRAFEIWFATQVRCAKPSVEPCAGAAGVSAPYRRLGRPSDARYPQETSRRPSARA